MKEPSDHTIESPPSADTVRDWEGIAAALADENERLLNVIEAILGHIQCGEGQRACQLAEQVLAENGRGDADAV